MANVWGMLKQKYQEHQQAKTTAQSLYEKKNIKKNLVGQSAKVRKQYEALEEKGKLEAVEKRERFKMKARAIKEKYKKKGLNPSGFGGGVFGGGNTNIWNNNQKKESPFKTRNIWYDK